MPKPKQRKKTPIPIQFDAQMERGLRKLKTETGLSISAIVRLAVKEYLAKK